MFVIATVFCVPVVPFVLLLLQPYPAHHPCGLPARPCPSQRTWQVFSKGAKFSMFKPAEEMVYIGLDAESRTKGKAAIDVVGAQTGKSGGSVLQQVQWAEANPRLREGIAECHAAHSGPLTSCLQVAGAHCCAISPHAGRHMQALSA